MTLRSLDAAIVGATLTLAAGSGGCYSGEQLIEQARNRAIRTRLDEVKLGTFRVTLPPEDGGDMSEIDITVYGEAARYRVADLEEELAEKAPLLGDLTTRALRDVAHNELTDPNLKKLRQRLLSTVNGVLEGEPIKSIGFHEVRFMRH
ncbi:MAG: hypothetical protein AAFV43_09870 [Planctomycetota bacterium]